MFFRMRSVLYLLLLTSGLNGQASFGTVGGILTGALYDPQGNLTQIWTRPGDASTQISLVYDALGRVSNLSRTGTSENYLYDDEGLRIKVFDSSTNTAKYNVYNEQRQLIAQYEKVGVGALTWKKDILYVGTKEIAEVDGSGTSITLVDHLGSPRFTWNGTGPFVQQKFLPFGESLADPVSASRFAKGFTNHEQTDPSGLIYMQARFYAPMYHRFASPDPARDQHFEETQSWNIYSYVMNNPIKLVDLNGMWETPGWLKTTGQVAWGITKGVVKELGSAAMGMAQAIAASRDLGSMGPNAAIGGGLLAHDVKQAGGPGGFVKEKYDQALDAYGRADAGQRAEYIARGATFVGLLLAPGAKGVGVGTKVSMGESVLLKEGTILNRVWDSRFGSLEGASGPFGSSFSPGSALPINAEVGVTTRGLNIPGVINNAEVGGLFTVTADTPALLRTSISGTAPELVIPKSLVRSNVELIQESVSSIPRKP